MSLRRRNIKTRIDRDKRLAEQGLKFKAFFERAQAVVKKYEAMRANGIEFTHDDFVKEAFGE